MIYQTKQERAEEARRIFSNASEFKEDDHPRGEDGKFGKGGGGGGDDGGKKKSSPKTAKNKPTEVFSDFINHMINVDLSGKMEESKQRGVATLYTDEIDLNTLVDISRFSRQYKKYKVLDGGRNRLSIIFPESKFWETHSFNWQPSR